MDPASNTGAPGRGGSFPPMGTDLGRNRRFVHIELHNEIVVANRKPSIQARPPKT